MPRIMIRCPKTDKPILTGLDTELISLASMRIPVNSLIVKMKVRCTACKKVHEWTYRDAWIEGDE